jgi:enediyne biosynthesis protein E4
MRLACLLSLCFALSGCSSPAPPAVSQPGTGQQPDWFADKADETGLKFVHFNGMSGEFLYAEIIGSGAALLDYDNDGDLDVFLVQGQKIGAGTPLFPPPAPLQGRLYRNDLTVGPDGARRLTFTDVTRESGIVAAGYGMGAATGDFDNDGCVDLFLTNLGPNQLWRNNCDGTFSDVSAAIKTDASSRDGQEPSWAVSAAFADVDRDGWLDLFVGHYLRYRVAANQPCYGASGRLDYCSPNAYRPQPSHLYHNNRDGTFTDVTAASGMANEFGPALGVVAADFNGDGWPDFYVANDGQPNQLWINGRNGTFKNMGLLSGTAMNPHGKAKAGMGVDAGDVDGDGDDDLLVTNLRGEGGDLFVNDGSALFEAQSERSGLAAASQPFTGFGAAWIDVDNDGHLDAVVVNGAVQTLEAERQARDPFPLHQPKLLLRNRGDGRFEDVTARGGAAFRLSDVSRGAAFGDLDNDGYPDVVVANNSGPVRLLMNAVPHRNHWVGLRLVGSPVARAAARDSHSGAPRRVGRDMLGARVAITRGDGTTLWRRARADGSYASANDPRVLAGLGETTRPVLVRVSWPDGTKEEWKDVPIDRYTTLQQGSGR